MALVLAGAAVILMALPSRCFDTGNTPVSCIALYYHRTFLCAGGQMMEATWPDAPSSAPARPYPPAINDGGDPCATPVDPLAAEVETMRGRLWVLDGGDARCEPQVFVYDLHVNKEVWRCSLEGVVVGSARAMVVDAEAPLGYGGVGGAGGVRAYVGDSGRPGGGLAVVALRERRFWFLDVDASHCAPGGFRALVLAIARRPALPTLGSADTLLYLHDPHKDLLLGIDLAVERDRPPPPVYDRRPEAVSCDARCVGHLLGASGALAWDWRQGLHYFLRRDAASVRWDARNDLTAEAHAVLLQDADALPSVAQYFLDSQRNVWALVGKSIETNAIDTPHKRSDDLSPLYIPPPNIVESLSTSSSPSYPPTLSPSNPPASTTSFIHISHPKYPLASPSNCPSSSSSSCQPASLSGYPPNSASNEIPLTPTYQINTHPTYLPGDPTSLLPNYPPEKLNTPSPVYPPLPTYAPNNPLSADTPLDYQPSSDIPAGIIYGSLDPPPVIPDIRNTASKIPARKSESYSGPNTQNTFTLSTISPTRDKADIEMNEDEDSCPTLNAGSTCFPVANAETQQETNAQYPVIDGSEESVPSMHLPPLSISSSIPRPADTFPSLEPLFPLLDNSPVESQTRNILTQLTAPIPRLTSDLYPTRTFRSLNQELEFESELPLHTPGDTQYENRDDSREQEISDVKERKILAVLPQRSSKIKVSRELELNEVQVSNEREFEAVLPQYTSEGKLPENNEVSKELKMSEEHAMEEKKFKAVLPQHTPESKQYEKTEVSKEQEIIEEEQLKKRKIIAMLPQHATEILKHENAETTSRQTVREDHSENEVNYESEPSLHPQDNKSLKDSDISVLPRMEKDHSSKKKEFKTVLISHNVQNKQNDISEEEKMCEDNLGKKDMDSVTSQHKSEMKQHGYRSVSPHHKDILGQEDALKVVLPKLQSKIKRKVDSTLVKGHKMEEYRLVRKLSSREEGTFLHTHDIRNGKYIDIRQKQLTDPQSDSRVPENSHEDKNTNETDEDNSKDNVNSEEKKSVENHMKLPDNKTTKTEENQIVSIELAKDVSKSMQQNTPIGTEPNIPLELTNKGTIDKEGAISDLNENYKQISSIQRHVSPKEQYDIPIQFLQDDDKKLLDKRSTNQAKNQEEIQLIKQKISLENEGHNKRESKNAEPECVSQHDSQSATVYPKQQGSVEKLYYDSGNDKSSPTEQRMRSLKLGKHNLKVDDHSNIPISPSYHTEKIMTSQFVTTKRDQREQMLEDNVVGERDVSLTQKDSCSNIEGNEDTENIEEECINKLNPRVEVSSRISEINDEELNSLRKGKLFHNCIEEKPHKKEYLSGEGHSHTPFQTTENELTADSFTRTAELNKKQDKGKDMRKNQILIQPNSNSERSELQNNTTFDIKKIKSRKSQKYDNLSKENTDTTRDNNDNSSVLSKTLQNNLEQGIADLDLETELSVSRISRHSGAKAEVSSSESLNVEGNENKTHLSGARKLSRTPETQVHKHARESALQPDKKLVPTSSVFATHELILETHGPSDTVLNMRNNSPPLQCNLKPNIIDLNLEKGSVQCILPTNLQFEDILPQKQFPDVLDSTSISDTIRLTSPGAEVEKKTEENFKRADSSALSIFETHKWILDAQCHADTNVSHELIVNPTTPCTDIKMTNGSKEVMSKQNNENKEFDSITADTNTMRKTESDSKENFSIKEPILSPTLPNSGVKEQQSQNDDIRSEHTQTELLLSKLDNLFLDAPKLMELSDSDISSLDTPKVISVQNVPINAFQILFPSGSLDPLTIHQIEELDNSNGRRFFQERKQRSFITNENGVSTSSTSKGNNELSTKEDQRTLSGWKTLPKNVEFSNQKIQLSDLEWAVTGTVRPQHGVCRSTPRHTTSYQTRNVKEIEESEDKQFRMTEGLSDGTIRRPSNSVKEESKFRIREIVRNEHSIENDCSVETSGIVKEISGINTVENALEKNFPETRHEIVNNEEKDNGNIDRKLFEEKDETDRIIPSKGDNTMNSRFINELVSDKNGGTYQQLPEKLDDTYKNVPAKSAENMETKFTIREIVSEKAESGSNLQKLRDKINGIDGIYLTESDVNKESPLIARETVNNKKYESERSVNEMFNRMNEIDRGFASESNKRMDSHFSVREIVGNEGSEGTDEKLFVNFNQNHKVTPTISDVNLNSQNTIRDSERNAKEDNGISVQELSDKISDISPTDNSAKINSHFVVGEDISNGEELSGSTDKILSHKNNDINYNNRGEGNISEEPQFRISNTMNNKKEYSKSTTVKQTGIIKEVTNIHNQECADNMDFPFTIREIGKSEKEDREDLDHIFSWDISDNDRKHPYENSLNAVSEFALRNVEKDYASLRQTFDKNNDINWSKLTESSIKVLSQSATEGISGKEKDSGRTDQEMSVETKQLNRGTPTGNIPNALTPFTIRKIVNNESQENGGSVRKLPEDISDKGKNNLADADEKNVFQSAKRKVFLTREVEKSVSKLSDEAKDKYGIGSEGGLTNQQFPMHEIDTVNTDNMKEENKGGISCEDKNANIEKGNEDVQKHTLDTFISFDHIVPSCIENSISNANKKEKELSRELMFQNLDTNGIQNNFREESDIGIQKPTSPIENAPLCSSSKLHPKLTTGAQIEFEIGSSDDSVTKQELNNNKLYEVTNEDKSNHSHKKTIDCRGFVANVRQTIDTMHSSRNNEIKGNENEAARNKRKTNISVREENNGERDKQTKDNETKIEKLEEKYNEINIEVKKDQRGDNRVNSEGYRQTNDDIHVNKRRDKELLQISKQPIVYNIIANYQTSDPQERKSKKMRYLPGVSTYAEEDDIDDYDEVELGKFPTEPLEIHMYINRVPPASYHAPPKATRPQLTPQYVQSLFNELINEAKLSQYSSLEKSFNDRNMYEVPKGDPSPVPTGRVPFSENTLPIVQATSEDEKAVPMRFYVPQESRKQGTRTRRDVTEPLKLQFPLSPQLALPPTPFFPQLAPFKNLYGPLHIPRRNSSWQKHCVLIQKFSYFP